MKTFLFAVFLGIGLCLAAEYLFLTGGGMPVATKGGPLPFEHFLAKKALQHAIADAGNQPSPIPADEANLLAGARVYHEQCAVCHGDLGSAPSDIAQGLFPSPPQLLPPKKGVTDDPVGETYWKVKNGIRLTGMPGYGDSLSDTAMWQVSLLLFHADKESPAVQAALRR